MSVDGLGTSTKVRPPNRIRPDFTGWFLRACVTVAFVGFGYAKFGVGRDNPWIEIFAKIGLGQWFRYTTGVVEILGGLLFLLPRTCLAGAALLAAAMLGATAAHLTVLHDPISIVITLPLFAAVVLIALRVPDDPTVWRVRGARRRG